MRLLSSRRGCAIGIRSCPQAAARLECEGLAAPGAEGVGA
jgi:hypothetical protein